MVLPWFPSPRFLGTLMLAVKINITLVFQMFGSMLANKRHLLLVGSRQSKKQQDDTRLKIRRILVVSLCSYLLA